MFGGKIGPANAREHLKSCCWAWRVEKDCKMSTKLSQPSGLYVIKSIRGLSANGQTLISNEDLSGKPSNFYWQGNISDNSLWAYPSYEASGCHFSHSIGKKKLLGDSGRKVKCFSAWMIKHLWTCEGHFYCPCLHLPLSDSLSSGTGTRACRWGGHGIWRLQKCAWKYMEANCKMRRGSFVMNLMIKRNSLSLQACFLPSAGHQERASKPNAHTERGM